MCGIGGIYIFDKSCDLIESLDHNLSKMGKILAHRGPDNQSHEVIYKNLGFVHRRLSILDLNDRANQPMATKKNSVITYNGEIYNYTNLKLEGYQYTGKSDTEVLLSRLEFEGIKTLEKLNGMYSFGFYKESEKELILARDPVGIKPLYYYMDDKCFVFSSEIKAIEALDFVKLTIDSEAVSQFFNLGYLLENKSGYKEIKSVRPGEYIKVKGKQLTKEYFHKWKIHSMPQKPLLEYQEILNSAVKARCISDVPITLFLSGGLDSATLALALSEKKNICANCLDLAGETFSESSKAQELANYLNLKLSITKQRNLTIDDIKNICYSFDELNADPAMISNYLLYEEVSKNYKVGIAGDGADELFMGYHAHKATYFNRIYSNRLLSNLCFLTGNAIDKIEKNVKYKFSEKLKRYGHFSKYNFPNDHLLWRSPDLEKILIKKQDFNYNNQFESMDLDLQKQMTLLDLQTYLNSNILKKVDRMSMAHGLEVRVPFLDKKMIEFSLSLDPKFKMKHNNQKIIMKNYLNGKIPKKILKQKKTGFGLDLEILMESKSVKEIIFEKNSLYEEYVDLIKLSKFFKNLTPYQKYTLLVFKFWCCRKPLNS